MDTKKTIPLPKKTRERILELQKTHEKYMSEVQKLEIAINELLFGVRDALEIDDTYTIFDAKVGFVKEEKEEKEEDGADD